MPAPVSIAHVHVHALRLASGAEALIARVLTVEGVAGFGFSFGTEAFPARDMAAWDAAARSRGAPLYALFGGKTRSSVEVTPREGNTIDPFDNVLLEEVREHASMANACALLAPNSHPWELAYCVALAATLQGEVRIAAHGDPPVQSIDVADNAGIGICWPVEAGFSALRWLSV